MLTKHNSFAVKACLSFFYRRGYHLFELKLENMIEKKLFLDCEVIGIVIVNN